MDAVFFDIDDTLYDQAVPFAWAVHQVLGAEPRVLDSELYASSRRHSGEVFAAFGRGERPSMECYIRRMRDTLADFGITVSEDQARRMQMLYFASGRVMRLSPQMAEILPWCAARVSKGLGCISNGTRQGQLRKLHTLGCDRWIPDANVIVSDDLDVAKPDARIFEAACARLVAAPEASLFIGDSYDIDVAGARGVGMPVIWFDRRHHDVPEGLADAPGVWIATDEDELFGLVKELVR